MVVIIGILSFLLSLGVLYFIKLYLTRCKINRGDTFFHLLLSLSIRKLGWKYPTSLQNVTFVEIDQNYDYLAYPPLFHFIISLFPTKFHLGIAKNFSLVIISFVSCLAAILTYNLTFDLVLAILSNFIVIFNYSAFDLVTQSTPRSLGLLFYSLILYVIIIFPENAFSLIAVMLFTALLTLTHKFAVQALLFGFLPFTFLFNKQYFFLFFIFGFLLSILISRGFYLRILREHLNWLRFYKDHPIKGSGTTKITTILGRNFWILLIVISMLFVAFKSIGGPLEFLIGTELFAKVVFWALINFLIAFLIAVPFLSFLGEYYRYVEYSLVPVGVLAPLFLASSNLYILLVSFACIFLSLLALLKFRKYLAQSKVLIDSNDVSSYKLLKEYNVSNLLVFPGNRTLEISYFSGVSVIHPVRGPKTASEHLANLINNYEIKYVLKFRDDDPYKLFATMTNMIKMKKIADFNEFEIFELPASKSLRILFWGFDRIEYC